MNRRAQIPAGDLQARWFRIASCIGTSWGFDKGPSRSLFRFFAPLSSRRRKGNPLPSPGRRCDLRAVDNRLPTKGRWPFGLKCIEHAVCRSIAVKNTITSNGIPEKALGPSKKGHFAQAQNRSFLSGAVTFFPEESMQRLARGYTPLTPAAYTATRQSEHSSVAVEGGAA